MNTLERLSAQVASGVDQHKVSMTPELFAALVGVAKAAEEANKWGLSSTSRNLALMNALSKLKETT